MSPGTGCAGVTQADTGTDLRPIGKEPFDIGKGPPHNPDFGGERCAIGGAREPARGPTNEGLS